MKLLKIKKNRVWGGAVICAALVLFLIPREAGAIWGVDPSGIVAAILHSVTYLIGIIGGLLISLAGYLVDWMLGLNSQILDSSNVLMYTGWRIARDFANLGFVLLTVIIAFATILRYKEYGYQKLLFNLIKAAILVNFSLAIAGVFIDFSDLATNFFKSRIGGGQDMAKMIVGAFAPQRLYLENDVANSEEARPPDEVGGGTKATVAMISSIAEMVFVIAFSLITAITMLGLAFMLLLRFVWLSFLLMVSPLVYLAWVMPGMQKHWKSWWDKFFQWVFFGPAVLFFVYVALLSAEKLGATPASITDTGNFFTSSLNGIMTQGAQMVILSAVMLGGLMAAQKMGIAGADAALKAAKGVGGGVQKWAGGTLSKSGQGLARTGVGTAIAGGLGKAGTALQKFGGWRPRNPAIRALTAPIRQPWQGAISAVGGGVSSIQSGLSAISSTDLEWSHACGFTDTVRTEKSKNKPSRCRDCGSDWKMKMPNLVGSMLAGAKSGSGLFKKESKVKDWVDDNGHVVRATKKPTAPCLVAGCGNNNWKASD